MAERDLVEALIGRIPVESTFEPRKQAELVAAEVERARLASSSAKQPECCETAAFRSLSPSLRALRARYFFDGPAA